MAARPMYQQIAEDLQAQIESGLLEPGAQLPTELELRDRYNSSRNTIRDAIKRLTSQGLVETRPGQGTFVTRRVDPFVTVLTGDPGNGAAAAKRHVPVRGQQSHRRARCHDSQGGDPGSVRRSYPPTACPAEHAGRQQARTALHRRHPVVVADVLLPDGLHHQGSHPAAHGRGHQRKEPSATWPRPSASGRSATETGSRRASPTSTSSRSSGWHTMPLSSRSSAPASTRRERHCASRSRCSPRTATSSSSTSGTYQIRSTARPMRPTS